MADGTQVRVLRQHARPDHPDGRRFHRFRFHPSSTGSRCAPPMIPGPAILRLHLRRLRGVVHRDTTSFGSPSRFRNGACAQRRDGRLHDHRRSGQRLRLRQSDGNLPAPGKRPISRCPRPSSWMATRSSDRRALVVAESSTGHPGDHQRPALRDDPVESLDQPRFHHQWMPDRLDFEELCPMGMSSSGSSRSVTRRESGPVGQGADDRDTSGWSHSLPAIRKVVGPPDSIR